VSVLKFAYAIDALADDLAVRPIDGDIRLRAKSLLSRIKELHDSADEGAVFALNECLFRIVYWTPSRDAFRMPGESDVLTRLRKRIFGDPKTVDVALMTAHEAAKYLNLDCKDPYQALYRLRKKKLVKATKVGGRVMYRRSSLDEFIEWRTEDQR
jgi:Helix-turn-helix domain